ncbi:MAG: hypothetical protein RL637_907 [Pseudomonadota bacterium]|jgi:hydroxymethylpyrimidine/phosphomethylpyrimidine kinase
MSTNYPVVLVFAGHDPSGGAGIQADIETLHSHHCHCVSVITALTEQDSSTVKSCVAQPADHILRYAQTLFADMPIAVIKIGLIANRETVLAIHQLLQQHPHIPVVFDPVLASGDGSRFSDESLLESFRQYLLPYTTVVTPNSQEARLLTELELLPDCGQKLLNLGCQYALITGTHESTALVENQLFYAQQQQSFSWQRLPYSYHGSGCTLASSIAGLLAQGLDPLTAIAESQDYTWNALAEAYKVGLGQHNPQRFFWIPVND